jgi:hypothetical protein
MRRIKPEVDIIKDILEAVLAAQPLSSFTQSLLKQYTERGSLSKKQLEGLFGKAQKVKTLSTAKLATLEAIILRMHTKNKSELPVPAPLYEKDNKTGELIDQILARFPAHKRVLYFKTRYENNETLTATELTELQRFGKLLLK